MTRRDVIDLPTYRRLPTEAGMETAIRQAVEPRGGRLWHIKDSRNCPEMTDYPDLTVIVPPYVMVLELKSQRRTVTPGQREVAELLRQCNQFVGGIVRPDPYKGEIAYDDVIDLLRSI